MRPKPMVKGTHPQMVALIQAKYYTFTQISQLYHWNIPSCMDMQV